VVCQFSPSTSLPLILVPVLRCRLTVVLLTDQRPLDFPVPLSPFETSRSLFSFINHMWTPQSSPQSLPSGQYRIRLLNTTSQDSLTSLGFLPPYVSIRSNSSFSLLPFLTKLNPPREWWPYQSFLDDQFAKGPLLLPFLLTRPSGCSPLF